jgi:hypothetical protein
MKRYELLKDFVGYCWMDEVPDGDYVKYEDVKELLEALEIAQWCQYNDPDNGLLEFCPECRNDRKHGHHPTCIIGIAINKARTG